MRFFILALLLIFNSSRLLADEIWLPKQKVQIDRSEFEELVGDHRLVVVGENHYDPAIVKIESDVVKIVSAKGPTTLGWEFLNRVDLEKVNAAVKALKAGLLTADSALELFFPNATATEYRELFETVRDFDASLIPTNLTREQKSPVTKSGINAAGPGIVPPGFEMGSSHYFERFKEAMGPHPLPSPIENYFASQCLTDDVMAYSLSSAATDRKVLVTGAFHGDYLLGAVERLKARSAGEDVLYIKVVQKNDLDQVEMEAVLNDPIYGPIADVLYVIESSQPTP